MSSLATSNVTMKGAFENSLAAPEKEISPPAKEANQHSEAEPYETKHVQIYNRTVVRWQQAILLISRSAEVLANHKAGTEKSRATKRVNMAVAAYTPRLCKFNRFNKNGFFGRDKSYLPLATIRVMSSDCS